MKNKKRAKYLAWTLMLIPISCSSPPKPGEEDKAITSNVNAIPLSVPVEFPEDLNKLVEDRDYAKAQVVGQAGELGTAANGKMDRTLASNVGHVIDYQVKSGDTLMKIAFKVLGDLTRWKEVLSSNQSKITNPSVLIVGTTLKINVHHVAKVTRNGEPYLIKRGDTLVKISNWVYGTYSHWKDLWNNNRELIHDPNKIYTGFSLYYLKQKLTNSGAKAPDVKREIATEPPK